ncbi:MAG TPA: hypothetical protein VFP91_10395, partial [Vicinamibacterales bacterium]|nr:hypothetical protein [Vicinamibacterales bacterium]
MIALLTSYAMAFAVRVYVRKYYVFLPDYARGTVQGLVAGSAARPTHIFVLLTDHFEPDYDVGKVEDWARRYAALAARHHDSTGRPPQHTFFYPGEQNSPAIYSILQTMTRAGLGEVELHFHHHYDTSDTLRPKLVEAIADFQRYGFLKTVAGRTQFAFIHGNSGLDNSNGDEMCGVTDEIRMLHGLGCFADFTFPSLFEDSQPHNVNSIYATRDDDGPKSYERRMPLTALRAGAAEMMIFQGPLIFSPSTNLRHLFIDLDDGDIHGAEHASAARVDRWIRANVHVPARPDWVFIKLFAHGISTPEDAEACLGEDFSDALSYLERSYNDGTRYVLHYINAREGYNLARAAG